MRPFLFFLLALVSLQASAQAPYVFKEFDLNPGAGDSDPSQFTVCNGKMFFVATTPATGYELWITDGTSAGTKMVKDIRPGGLSSLTGHTFSFTMQVLGTKVVFVANDGTNGEELWISDGTAAGTFMLKDIEPGSGYSSPTSFAVLNSKLIFSARTIANGGELWITDGTSTGTVMLKEIVAGSSGGDPNSFINWNGKVYFSAWDPTNGAEFWKTDGTTAGTVLIKDIVPGANTYGPTAFHPCGTSLLFALDDGITGWELWKTDGTAAGTAMVKDINPGAADGLPILTFVSPRPFYFDFNGKVYFRPDHATYGNELWVTDGTTAGTQLIKDIRTNGNLNSDVDHFGIINNKLYFSARDTGNNHELWVTDGTTAGTQLAVDVIPGKLYGSFGPTINNTVYKKKIYFNGPTAAGDQRLYKSDGTPAGTSVIGPSTTYQYPTLNTLDFVIYDSTVYFQAKYSNNGWELWSMKDTTGTGGGSTSVSSIMNSNEFTLYPNPGDGNFTIKTDRTDFIVGTVSVLDVTGREVYSHTINPSVATSGQTIQLDANAKGVYFVKLRMDDLVMTKQIVVE